VTRLTAATDAADPRQALALLPAASPCGGDQDKGRALAGNEAIWNCTGLQSAFAIERFEEAAVEIAVDRADQNRLGFAPTDQSERVVESH
jgi:hypothetical protein